MAKPAQFDRRHFEKMAEIIATMEKEGTFEPSTVRDIATFFADCLKETNPNFDRQRFIAACKYND